MYAASTLMIAATAILFWAAGQDSHAQQGPNRQLVQTGSTKVGNGKRIALVIGNGAYTNAPPLKNPPNDARDMAATLKALGFEVTSGINVNQREMKRLMREFGQKLKTGGSGLFYYAGHGVQSKARNYLIPVDADIQSEVEAEDAGVDVSLLLGYMDDAQNGLNIVILDACRNNPFARSFRSAANGLAQVDAPTGTLIAYATAPGRVASDGTSRNGLYTSELLQVMGTPGLSIEEVFKRVRAGVQRQTNGQQIPWESSSLVGDFSFTPANASGSKDTSGNSGITTGGGIVIDPSSFELSYWDTVKNSTDANDFKAYLEKYPNGQFAALAKNRVTNLEATSKPAESRSAGPDSSATELAFWDSIKASTSADDYKVYLKKYPSGAFVELANNRLAAIEAGVKEKEKAEAARLEAAEFAKISVAGTRWTGKSPGKDKTYVIEFAADGTFTMSLDYFGSYTINGPWTQDRLEVKGHDLREPDGMPGMNGAEVTLTLSADGQRMEGEWHKKGGKKKYGLVMQRDSRN